MRSLVDLAAWLGCFALATAVIWFALVIGDLLAMQP